MEHQPETQDFDETGVLTRFRENLASGAITLRQVEEQTGIPYTTLIKMRREGWQQKTFERFRTLKAFMSTVPEPVNSGEETQETA